MKKKLILGGLLLGLLSTVALAQMRENDTALPRTQASANHQTALPDDGTMVSPNATTVAPDATTVRPNVKTKPAAHANVAGTSVPLSPLPYPSIHPQPFPSVHPQPFPSVRPAPNVMRVPHGWGRR